MIQAVEGSGEVITSSSNTGKNSNTRETQVIQHDAYPIEKTSSQAFPHETHPAMFVLGNTIGWFFCGCYLSAEISYIWSIRRSTTNFAEACMWIGLLAESFLFFVDLTWALDAVISMLKPKKENRRPHYRLLGDRAPHVDIFVTCCGEPIDVVMNTVKAAATQDYPTSRYNVVVLDDGHDNNLRAAVDEFNKNTRNVSTSVHYRSREVHPGTRSFFKAGNLNFGIQQTKQSSNGEFLASLDSDMIIVKDWLRRMVPHLLLDAKLGLATSPQNFYNVPKGDQLAQQGEFTLWNSIFEPIHDHVGEAMCMGTGFVVRRAALEDIGGWPLAETGEDYMCSTKLMAKGWKIAYIRENMQHGITPESYQSRVKQRLRWVDAAFEVHQSNNWYLTNDLGDGVTVIDKAASVVFALRDLSAVSTVWSLLALPVVIGLLSTSKEILSQPVPSNKYDFLTGLLITTFITSKFGDWLVYHRAGLSHLSNVQSMDVWAAPYCAIRCLSYLLRTSSTRNLTFFVTGSHTCAVNERDRNRRAPLHRRITSFHIPFHLGYVLACTCVVGYCLTRPESSLPLLLPGHVLMVVRCGWKMAVPPLYMAFPPDVGPWRDHLVEDAHGVWRPRNPFPAFVRPDQGAGVGVDMGLARWGRDALEVAVFAWLCWTRL